MDYDYLGRPKPSQYLLKLFVVCFILTVMGLMFFACFGRLIDNTSGRTHEAAQDEADRYLKTTHLAETQGAVAVCVDTDSDGDGYVSCPYVTKDGVTHPLECATGLRTSMVINKGCRPPKAVMSQPFNTQSVQ